MNKLITLIAVLGACGVTLSCSSQAPQRDPGPGIQPETGSISLLAERQSYGSPTPRHDLAIRLMDGVIEDLVPGSAQSTQALTPLSQILSEYSTPLRGTAPSDETRTNPEAARRYASAREAMLSNDLESATTLLLEAHAVDPDSARIKATLADIFAKQGDLAQAATFARRASELGDTSPRTLLLEAMGSQDDPDTIIRLTSRIWSGSPSRDPGALVIAGVILGNTLMDQGSLSAGAEVLRDALERLDERTLADPNWRRELIGIYTRRPELWTGVGDVYLELELPDNALRAYETAQTLVSRTPPTLLQRISAAHASAGRTAMCVLTLLDAIDNDPGAIGHVIDTWFTALASETGLGAQIVEELRTRADDPEVLRSQRARCLRIALLISNDPDRSSIILQNDPSIVTPISVMIALESAPDPIDRADVIVESNPALATPVAAALTRVQGEPIRAIESLNPGSTLRLALAVQLDRSDLIDPGFSPSTDDPTSLSPSLVALWIQALAQLERYEQADQLIQHTVDRFTSFSEIERSSFINAILQAHHDELAIELAGALDRAPDPGSTDLLTIARVSLAMGDPQGARSVLERAMTVDPLEEAIYEQLITLHAPGGPLESSEELQNVTRALTQSIPSSALVALIRANDMARQGLLEPAMHTLVEQFNEQPRRSIGLDLLISLWRTLADRGDQPEAMVGGIELLRERLAEDPGSIDVARSLARMLNSTDQRTEAIRILSDLAERYASRSVERSHEAMLRTDPERAREADELALSRLEGRSGLAHALERLEIASRLDRMGTLGIDEFLPEHSTIQLSPDESRRIVAILSTHLRQSNSDDEKILALTERARRMSRDGDAALAQIELVAFAGTSEYTPETYESKLRAMMETQPPGTELDPQPDLVVIAIQGLQRAGHTEDITPLLARACVIDNEIVPQRVVNLATILGRSGTIDDARLAADILAESGFIAEAAAAAEEGLGTSARPETETTEAQDKADFIYSTAVVAMFFEREDAAMELYRGILELDPNHAWACNDLGYHLAERLESLDEAEQLLERAHAALPDNASVLDSLAWVRYGRGILLDEKDDQGNITREGAITLLERSLELDKGNENPTVHDHLGDARWMAKDFDGAIEAWKAAEEQIGTRLTELIDTESDTSDAQKRLGAQLGAIRAKLSDASLGEPPDVAPNAADLEVPIDDRDPE